MLRFPLLLSLFGLALAQSNAAVLVNYNISGSTYATASAVTSKDPLVTATSITSATTPVPAPGSGNGPGSFSVSNSSGQAFLQYSASSSSVTGALANRDYLQFSITVDAANTLDLGALSVTYKAEGSAVNAYLALFMSLDGFATAPTAADVVDTLPFASSTSYNTSSLNVPTSAYKGLTNQTVTFRIYGYDDSSGTGSYMRLENFSIIGTVPEPATAALTLIAAPLAFLRRRRA